MTYNPDFLKYKPVFSEKELTLFAELNKQFSLEKFLQDNRAINELEIDFVFSSAIIEGNTYSQADTEALLKYGQTAGGKRYSDSVMLMNLRDGWQYIITQEPTANYKLLKDIHFEIMKGGLLENRLVGTIRDEFVAISGTNYRPLATRQQIDTELKYLFKTAANIDNPFEKAIYLHNNIAYLQPFKDGNKRCARMLQMASLINDGLIPLLGFAESVRRYLEGIINYYEHGNHQDMGQYFLESYQRMFLVKFNTG